jgi:hypothetical protein
MKDLVTLIVCIAAFQALLESKKTVCEKCKSTCHIPPQACRGVLASGSDKVV